MVQDAAVISLCRAGSYRWSLTPTTMLNALASLTGAATMTRLTPRVEIGLELLGLHELAGAFEDDVAAEVAPRHLARRGGGGEADALAADDDGRVAVDLERRAPAAMDAVEFEEMGGGRRTALDLVDMRDLEPVSSARIAVRSLDGAERRPQGEAPHPAHAVDADLHGGPLCQMLAAVAEFVQARLQGNPLEGAEREGS